MVLETLFTAKTIHRHPLLMVLHAIIMSSIAMFIAYYVFRENSSWLGIAFFTIGLIPLMETLLKHEEKKEARHPGFAPTFLARHFNILQAFAWIFIGLIISYAFWYSVLPVEMEKNIFSAQESSLTQIGQLKSDLSGEGMFAAEESPCGRNAFCWFEAIAINNASVLALAIILSIVFGAGAIFLIAWNASIIGVVIGKDVLALAASYTQFGLFNGLIAFSHGMFNALGLVPHGLFEASGYFIGAIAGAIIGIMITKRHYYRHEPGTIAKDAFLLVITAFACIAIGAAIEALVIVSSF
ncbi:MAG: stage II sporulation protein M [Candidatus ainarchaeum sp.]|nr:stage II sporulation protein M [Candidatus ainarchaeum sp.]